MDMGTQGNLNSVSTNLLQKDLPYVISGRITCHGTAGLDLALLLVFISIYIEMEFL